VKSIDGQAAKHGREQRLRQKITTKDLIRVFITSPFLKLLIFDHAQGME